MKEKTFTQYAPRIKENEFIKEEENIEMWLAHGEQIKKLIN